MEVTYTSEGQSTRKRGNTHKHEVNASMEETKANSILVKVREVRGEGKGLLML